MRKKQKKHKKKKEEKKGRDMKPKTTIHAGKSFGICKKCNKTFRLKRKTKHKKGTIKGVICPECGKKETENNLNRTTKL